MNRNNHDGDLSIIIVSKNEEKHIGDCIESILIAMKDIKSSEIILVDSVSTDKTIEIAKNYPIKIIQLDPSWQLSPSAGKYIGFCLSNGRYILFIDGDMTLDKNWIKIAIPVLDDDRTIAGVAGLAKENSAVTSLLSKKRRERFKHWNVGEVDILVGAALYKRYVLDEVHPYNPYLYGNEEAELCYRIRDAGYKLIRLSHPMIVHHGKDISSMNELIRRWQNKYFLGRGQILRYSLKSNKRIFLRHIKRLWLDLSFMIWIFAGLASLFVLVLTKNTSMILIWIIISALAFIAFSIKKKSVRTALFIILLWYLTSWAMLRGFIKHPKDPSTYPTNVNYKSN